MNTIKIGGVVYSVKMQDRLEDNGEVVWGLSNFGDAIIEIRSELNPQKTNQTIIHECVHIMLHEAGLNEETYDERLVTALGNMLYQIIIDNSAFIKRIEMEK